MTSFDQKFVENPLFLKWIFNTNPVIETYWAEYLQEHPEEKDQLIELKDRLMVLKFTNDGIEISEREDFKRQIGGRINLGLENNTRRLPVILLMKFAAVALLVVAISGLVIYKSKKETFYQEFAQKMIPYSSSAQGPVLITSNGKNVDLKKANSTVDYSHNGAVVLNNDSVLQTADISDVMNQLVIPYGNQSKVVLSDNTVVWLNAGSRLVYPTFFKGKAREVLLFGEAYFEVTKNPEKPFIVKTSGVDIKVLGTKFNVSAYSEDNQIQTVLKEGSVAVHRKGAGLFEPDVVIKPNEMASFDKIGNTTNVSEVVADAYILWTQGLVSFEEVDFSRVVKQIERYYNISINFSDRKKELMRLSGKLDLKQGRLEVIEYLEKVSLSRFGKVTENQYIIN